MASSKEQKKKTHIGKNPLDWIKSTKNDVEHVDAVVTQVENTRMKADTQQPSSDHSVEKTVGSAKISLKSVEHDRTIESKPEKRLQFPETHQEAGYYMIPVSAKSEEILIQRIKDLMDWILEEGSNQSIRNAAYTLGAGRSHFAVRAAFIASDMEHLARTLKDVYVSGNAQGFFKSQSEAKPKRLGQDSRELAEKTTAELSIVHAAGHGAPQDKLAVLADLYTKGYDVDWNLLYNKNLYRKISMPTYPFLRDRYWVETDQKEAAGKTTVNALHPLIDRNSSTLYEESFVKSFDGTEFFLKDHVVGKEMILPGVAYLEMARAAAGFADTDRKTVGFRDVVWVNPIKPDGEGRIKDIHIGLYPENGYLEYEVISELESQHRMLHGKGKIILENIENIQPSTEVMDIDAIKQRCTKKMEGKLCYERFNSRGLILGKSFQSIVELCNNDNEVLAKLELPSHLNGNFNEFGLHPALMDGALEAVIGLVENTSTESSALSLPFAINEVEILGQLTENCYSYACESTMHTQEGVRKFDISILDGQGKVLVKMKGFSLKALQQGTAGQQTEMLYYNPVWEQSPADDAAMIEETSHIVYLGAEDELFEALSGFEGCSITLVKQGNRFEKIKQGVYQVFPGSKEDFEKLIDELVNEGIQPDRYINAWWKDTGFDAAQAGDEAFYSMLALTQAAYTKMPDVKIRCIYAYNFEKGAINPYNQAISGFAKSINVENTKFTYTVVGIDQIKNASDAAGILMREMEPSRRDEAAKAEAARAETAKAGAEVKYEDGKRLVKRLAEVKFEAPVNELPLKENGVYVITGGAGGLGLIFAGHIASKAKVNIVLTGRSELSGIQKEKIQKFESGGCEVKYIKADICDKKQVNALAEQVKALFGQVNGVIHSAGVTSDAFVQNKTAAHAKQVLDPKVAGTIYLDEAFKDENLDFFAMFSSIAAVTGNAGQCDYSYANSFMDNYSLYRQNLVEQGKRKGNTLSVNWPLWKDGGMKVDSRTETLFKNTMGIMPLETEKGLEAFTMALSHNMANILVVDAIRKKAEKALGINRRKADASYQMQVDEKEILSNIQEGLTGIVSGLLKIKVKDISLSREISEFGFNSLTLTDLSNSINEKFNIDITPAVFFEHSTLGSLINHLLEEYKDEMVKLFGQGLRVEEKDIPADNETHTGYETVTSWEQKAYGRFRTVSSPDAQKALNTKHQNEPIAIIGMSGVMPQSEDLEEFWANLESQHDLISEIPADRWDWKAFARESEKGSNKPVSKWGGFMKEVDKFDAMFFGISPREACLMDPQQRLFLQTVWNTVEDAGYRIKDLSGSKTGLFVGVATMDYSDLLRENQIEIEAYSSTGASHCILANRISYMFNWHGPSEPIDTACSSSLIAIHRGVESIRNGDCDMAVAGGVNVIVSPMLHISFSRAGMLSEDGRCKTFDKSANGYVRGEGCGAVLLKPLSKALEDGDHIYAVVRGTAVNHGGRANSLTAPNPNAQAELIVTAYEKAGFEPDTVTYIEAHGTGTNLGDPVEINGLKLAFKELYKRSGKPMVKTNYCNLSSVKTNIGHLEAAAGIAGILKVLLAMEHGKIPGNVHLTEINPYIDVQGTPINIVSQTKNWENLMDADGKIIPKRAGVSSFGFGGANAHIALEEYIPVNHTINKPDSSPQVVVLSAKSTASLTARAERLAAFLQSQNGKKHSLRDIAYTLQVGREDMEERLAIVANNKDELVEKLTLFVNGSSNIPDLFTGNVEQNKESVLLSSNDDEEREYLNLIIKKGKLDKIALLYINGAAIDWKVLHKGYTPKRIPLPGYPFAKDVYWVPKGSAGTGTVLPGTVVRMGGSSLHPLVDVNQSTLFEQTFKKTLKKEEFFLRDHIVNRKVLLPGVAYLEMVRAAAELAGMERLSTITDVVWLQPIVMEEAQKDIYISLYPGAENVKFEVYGIVSGEKAVHCEGRICGTGTANCEPPQTFDIEAIRKRCTTIRQKDECYSVLYKNVGFDYGSTFKVTKELLSAENEVLAQLELPGQLLESFGQYVLHPSLFDGAIRAIAGMGEQKHGQVHIPFALGSMEVFAPIPEKCYSYSTIVSETKGRDSGTMRFSISVLDEEGHELVRIKDFTARPYKEKRQNEEMLYFKPVWEDSALSDGAKKPSSASGVKNANTLLIFGNQGIMHQEISRYYEENNPGGKVILVTAGESFSRGGNNLYTVNPAEYKDYCALLDELLKTGHTLSYILCMWRLGDGKAQSGLTDSYQVMNTQVDSLLASGVYTAMNIFNAVNRLGLDGKVRCMFAFDAENEVYPCTQALAGFASSIPAINHKFELITLQLEKASPDRHTAKIAVDELLNGSNTNRTEIKYAGGSRKVKAIKAVDAVGTHAVDTTHAASVENNVPVLKQDGVYIITGGLGSLGMLFARSLAAGYKARLVLTGRSALDENGKRKLHELEVLGAKVEYIASDISVYSEAAKVVQTAKSHFGRVDGILHCAGILGSKPIFEADKADFEKVLSPKIHGTLNLDLASKDEQLDLFVMFSSVSTELGDMGACSYAAANSFMDKFAYRRDELKQKGMRHGKTVSINWPLWTEGGMEIPAGQAEMYFGFSGMKGLENENGLEAFYKVLEMQLPQVIVTVGDAARIKRVLKVKDAYDSYTSHESEHVYSDQMPDTETAAPEAHAGGTAGQGEELFKAAEDYFKKILSESINLPPNKINSKASFEKYGIDSIMIMELNKRLEKEFESLTKTLFFEYNNVYELTGYFVKNYKNRLMEILHLDKTETEDSSKTQAAAKSLVMPKASQAAKISTGNRFMGMQWVQGGMIQELEHIEDDDIAIIGLNGKYPMSNDLDEFWNNLKNGRDCITEVPEDRWNHSKYYDPQKGRKDRVYSKWGGFIHDVDKFDPLFFQITPRDAEIIDPQERLFLENVYGTLEDAGYTRTSLSNSRVGVFVGVMYGHYQLFGAEETMRGNLASLSSSYSSIANRVSYFFNFQGPSIALDTMCSSSLTAIHLACESIHRGESDMAVAGGVNVTIHLDKYIFLSQQRFAASDGRCRAFGADGDGYVPGEGVGSVLLKPLKKALEDRDHIYAVIKATAVNHGGKTSGYSVPNPNAQGSLIAQALKKAKINPRTLGYLEAHGTGTSLGDPIEITGLMKAFSEYTNDRQYCRIGSVKSNIGHAESAAGIASLTKVLLQMKNKKLVPSIHSDTLNPNINFADSPFMVQQKYEDWNTLVITENGIEEACPRRAGISSFGAGGANVHLIVEEYPGNNRQEYITSEPQLIVLSARTEDRLKEYCKKLTGFLTGQPYDEEDSDMASESILSGIHDGLVDAVAGIMNISSGIINIDMDFEELGFEPFTLTALAQSISYNYGVHIPVKGFAQLSTVSMLAKHIAKEYKGKADMQARGVLANDHTKVNLADVAYTLQVGREALDGVRLAAIVSTIDELAAKLEDYSSGAGNIENLYVQNLKKSGTGIYQSEVDEDAVSGIVQKRELDDIAKAWVSGADIDWKLMYPDRTPNRISLPTYPFEKLRCWFTPSGSTSAEHKAEVRQVLHPMIDANVSTLEEQCFKKAFSQKDFYMRDHVVRGNMILPGVAYLEMVWAAACLSSRKNKVSRLRNVVWASPLELVDKQLEAYVGLYQTEHGVEYEVYTSAVAAGESGRETGRVIHSKGKVDYIECEEEKNQIQPEKINIEEIRQRCTNSVDGQKLYSEFENTGFEYGQGLRSIHKLYCNDNEILSQVSVPDGLEAEFGSYTLHPSILDAALQSLAGFEVAKAGDGKTLFLPFSLGGIEVINPLSKSCFVYITMEGNSASPKSGIRKYRIYITGEDGQVLVTIKDFTGRELKNHGMMEEPHIEDIQASGQSGDTDEDSKVLSLLQMLENGEMDLDEAQQLMEEI